jgi:hypothetical protein
VLIERVGTSVRGRNGARAWAETRAPASRFLTRRVCPKARSSQSFAHHHIRPHALTTNAIARHGAQNITPRISRIGSKTL